MPPSLLPPLRYGIVDGSPKQGKGAIDYFSGNGVTIRGNLCARVRIAAKDAETHRVIDLGVRVARSGQTGVKVSHFSAILLLSSFLYGAPLREMNDAVTVVRRRRPSPCPMSRITGPLRLLS